MSECVITCDDEVAMWVGNDVETMKRIVQCMDCMWFENDAMHGAWCKNFGASLHDDYDGFCAWGMRKNG